MHPHSHANTYSLTHSAYAKSVHVASLGAGDGAEAWKKKTLSWNGSLISQRTIRPAIAEPLPWSQWWHSIEICSVQTFTLRGYECCCSPLTVLCMRSCVFHVSSGCTSVEVVAGSVSLVASGFLFSSLSRSLLFSCTCTCTNKWSFTLTLEPHQIGSSCEESAGFASPWWAFLLQSCAAKRACEERFIVQ